MFYDIPDLEEGRTVSASNRTKWIEIMHYFVLFHVLFLPAVNWPEGYSLEESASKVGCV